MARVANVELSKFPPDGMFRPTGEANPINTLIFQLRGVAKRAFQKAEHAPANQKEKAVKSLAQTLRDLATKLETECSPEQPKP